MRAPRPQAGLLLAETEYVKQVESDIASYKGLLMGLFFMTVGMEISVGLFFARYRTVLAAMAVLIAGKARTPPPLPHRTCLAGAAVPLTWRPILYCHGEVIE